MLRQLARTSPRVSASASAARRVQSRSLHSPFAVLSSQSKATEASKSTASQSQSNTNANTTEKKEFELEFESDASSSPESTNPRVYVVSHPDPALGAPFGVQLGAYPVSEPFAR